MQCNFINKKRGHSHPTNPIHGWIQSMYLTTLDSPAVRSGRSNCVEQSAERYTNAWQTVYIPSTAAAARLTCSRFPTVAKHKL